MKAKKETKQEFLFGKRNYIIMLVGLFVIALGFVFMAGGGGEETTVFKNENYN